MFFLPVDSFHIFLMLKIVLGMLCDLQDNFHAPAKILFFKNLDKTSFKIGIF